MKCELCGRHYIALGVHLRHKHGVDPDDYREQFGITRMTPLVDEDLSAHISACAKRRLEDDNYKAEVQARCRENAEANKGKPWVGMTQAGKAAVAKSNSKRNAEYLKRQAPKVANVLREKKTMTDVTRELGTSRVVGKKMAAMAGVEYIAQSARAEGAKRAAVAARAKAMIRVEKVMVHFYTTKSAAEMCRRGGIGIKTYRNWLNRGLIQRHPNGRGPRVG